MLYLSFILLSLILLTVFSAFAHEYGHIFAAKKLGHTFHGFQYHWYGIGAKIDITNNPKDLWKIALSGLLATFIICLISLSFVNFILIYYLFVLNILILLINSIPIGPTDGRQIIKGLKNRGSIPN